jgi:hypothetical protein
MNTSQTSILSKPDGDNRVDKATLAYFQVRNRGRLYDLVLGEFERSGISQATLARRLGKRPELVSRFLASPGNWENDSVSDYLFAISGSEPVYALGYPLQEAVRNYSQPDWVASGTTAVVYMTVTEDHSAPVSAQTGGTEQYLNSQRWDRAEHAVAA